MLLRWSKQVDQGLVGLDIGSSFIKLIDINSTTKPQQVQNFAVLPLPAGAVVKGEMKDYAIIGNVLKDLFRKSNVQTKSVALAIPRSSVIIKNITVDTRLNSSEIESRAWIEANHHFPDLVGEIYLDFTVTPSVQDPTQLDMTLVACRKDQIKPYLEVLREGGVKAKIIDVNSNALERALVAQIPSDLTTTALLNLDTNISTFLVMHDQKQIYAHDHTYDGQRLQTQVHDYLETTLDKTASLNDLGYMETLKGALTAHLRHTLHFFYSSRPNVAVQRLILSGDCAMTPCLGAFIQQEIGIETVLANPFANMTMAPQIDAKQLESIAPTMMLCCGLGLSVDPKASL